MNIRKFLKDFVLEKLIFKSEVASFLLLFGTASGLYPNFSALWKFLLYNFGYFHIYFFNDLMDYRNDMLRKLVYRSKALVLGYANESEFKALSVISLIPALLLLKVDKILGKLLFSALVIGDIRTFVSDLELRSLLLAVLEFINFLAFWRIFFGPPGGEHIKLILGLSAVYAFLYYNYKVKVRSFEEVLRNLSKPTGFLFLLGVAALFCFSLRNNIAILLYLLTSPLLILLLIEYLKSKNLEKVLLGMFRKSLTYNLLVTATNLALLIIFSRPRVMIYAYPIMSKGKLTEILELANRFRIHLQELI